MPRLSIFIPNQLRQRLIEKSHESGEKNISYVVRTLIHSALENQSSNITPVDINSNISTKLALKTNTGTVQKTLKKDKEINFVELFGSEPPSELNARVSCTLQRPDGAKLIMETQGQQIVDLMRDFLCCK